MNMKFMAILVASVIGVKTYCQECVVEVESLKGKYTGECKKGKANGKGKAEGTDVYEGEFRSGRPHGEGTYTWGNGNVFKGHFEKGLREGKGMLTYKKPGKADSVVEGFWKADMYIGKYEKPYTVYNKGRTFGEVDIKFQKDVFHQINFFVTNTSGGIVTTQGETYPRFTVDDIYLISGSYGKLTHNDEHAKKTETILTDVIFPMRMRVIINREEIELEFREVGSYTVEIHINQ